MNFKDASLLIKYFVKAISEEIKKNYEATYIEGKGWTLKEYRYNEHGYEGCFNGIIGTREAYLTSNEMIWYLEGIARSLDLPQTKL